MQTNRELIKALADQSEYAESLIYQMFQLLEDKAEMILDNREFKGISTKLVQELNHIKIWASELEERSKELDHLQVTEIRETTTISR